MSISEEQIAARIERLPLAGWYVKTMIIVGQAGFFDSFNALTITFVLPVLAVLWKLSPPELGLLVSLGYVGQLLGAVWLAGLAERVGRLRVLRWSVVIMGVLSLACALAWSYQALLFFRFVQGIGLGAEVPVAATYMNELTRADMRGRLMMLFQMIFGVGIFAASVVSIWVIPNWGWQAMFYIGVLPAILGITLLYLVPESPRWLAAHGRSEEADRALCGLEARAEAATGKTLPSPAAHIPPVHRGHARFGSLFEGVYLVRTLTLWTLAFLVSIVGYGLNVWMPTLYRTVYHLPQQTTLIYSLSLATMGVCGAVFGWFIIDRIGRRRTFMLSFSGSAVPLLILALGFVGNDVTVVMLFTAVGLFFSSLMLAGLFVFFPENYPTRMRAMGSGVASAWMRIGSIVGPILVGQILANFGVANVYLLFGVAAVLGAVVVWGFIIETNQRTLEDISA
jgi:putative MFS transporter